MIVLVILGQMHPYPKMLATSSSTVRRIDDTEFPTALSGTIYVVDTNGNTVYTVIKRCVPAWWRLLSER